MVLPANVLGTFESKQMPTLFIDKQFVSALYQACDNVKWLSAPPTQLMSACNDPIDARSSLYLVDSLVSHPETQLAFISVEENASLQSTKLKSVSALWTPERRYLCNLLVCIFNLACYNKDQKHSIGTLMTFQRMAPAEVIPQEHLIAPCPPQFSSSTYFYIIWRVVREMLYEPSWIAFIFLLTERFFWREKNLSFRLFFRIFLENASTFSHEQKVWLRAVAKESILETPYLLT